MPISNFPIGKLSSVAKIQSGYAFASERFTDNLSDIPLVKGENVQQGFVDWKAARYWPVADSDAFEDFRLLPGDIVVAMDRPWVQAGLKWAYIRSTDPAALLVQRVARLRAKPGVEQTYLRCLISSEYFSAYLQPIVTGVNVPHISGKQIGDFPIPIPDAVTQLKITAVLSAYDDLIANSQRRIALLEAMAEEIYREWFVRMRFPGSEAARRIRGLPEGWSERRLFDVAEVNARSVLRGHEPERIRYVDISAVGTNEMGETAEMNYTEAPGRARRVVRHGDVLWSSVRPGNKAYCLVVEPPENLVASTGFAVISPKPGTPYAYLYKAVTTQNFTDQMVAVAKGSAYPATSFDDFGKARIVWPSAALLAAFHQKCQPMIECCAGLRKVIAHLRKTRDAVLPRLISGKLKVDHLDIQLPPSMQDKAAA